MTEVRIGASLVDGAVTSASLAEDAVTERKLAAGAVSADKLAADAVTDAKLAAAAVTEQKLAAGAVSADKLAADAVTDVKLAAGAVTRAKLAQDAQGPELADGAVTTVKLADGSVTAGKLAAGAVGIPSLTQTGHVLVVNSSQALVQASPPRAYPIPAKAFSSPQTNAAAPGAYHGTNITLDTRDFDATTEEHADLVFPWPRLYDGGDLRWSIFWTAASGSGAVVWEVNLGTPADGASLDSAPTFTGTVTDTFITANSAHVASLTQTANLPSANDFCALRISRKAGDTADTLATDARLIAVMLQT